MKTLLVTGGAGFIGSALVRQLIQETDWCVVNVDKLTYAGHTANLARLELSEPGRGTFYTNNAVDFLSGAVYTVFVFDYAGGPSAVLTTGR